MGSVLHIVQRSEPAEGDSPEGGGADVDVESELNQQPNAMHGLVEFEMAVAAEE